MSSTTNRRTVTIAVMVATLLVAIDGTVVSTAMPTIVSQLGGLKLMSWMFAGFLLTTAVTTPIWGKLSDLFGRKVIFNTGIALFLVGSVLCGMAQNMNELILARAFQGIGGGAVFPLTLTIISDIYTVEERAKIQGLFGAIWGVSSVLGPLVGGFFVDVLTWRWIFYINLPFGLLSMVLVWKSFAERFEHRQTNIDYAGAVTFTLWTTSFLYALLNGGTTYPWSSPVIISCFAVSLVLFLWFLRIESKAVEPLLPLYIFRIRDIVTPNISGFFMSAIVIGVSAYLPLLIQGVQGHSATNAGLALTPISLGWSSGAAIAGPLLVRIGVRKVSLIGGLFLLIGSFWLPFVPPNSVQWVLFVVMMFGGWGFGFIATANLFVVQSAVQWNLRGVATASNQFINALSQTVSVAVLGTSFNHVIVMQTHSRFSSTEMNKLLDPKFASTLPSGILHTMRSVLFSGLHSLFWILAGVSLVCFLASFWLPNRLTSSSDNAQKVPDEVMQM